MYPVNYILLFWLNEWDKTQYDKWIVSTFLYISLKKNTDNPWGRLNMLISFCLAVFFVSSLEYGDIELNFPSTVRIVDASFFVSDDNFNFVYDTETWQPYSMFKQHLNYLLYYGSTKVVKCPKVKNQEGKWTGNYFTFFF